MLSGDLQSRMVDALGDVPITDTLPGRTSLLTGISRNIVSNFNRDPHRSIDLSLLVGQLDSLGRLEETGVRPLLIFLNAALKTVEGTTKGRKLKDLILEVEKQDEEEEFAHLPPPITEPEIPEALIFGGNDERLSVDFFRHAIAVQSCVARLQVPRIFGNNHISKITVGTGWLIAPTLLCTNYHVIQARDITREKPASISELRAQALATSIWFDYHYEGGSRTEYRCVELVRANSQFDYALLRLICQQESNQRSPLRIAPSPLTFYKGDRLNIVQYPAGGALRYAIRNNICIGQVQNTPFIRYLTDTEHGASGSPICNDDWYVVGMHRAAREVRPQNYQGETIRYHNEGIEIHAILGDLPPEINQEIAHAQGW